MRSFAVEHIDALITTAGGLFVTFLAYRSRRAGRVSTPTQERAFKFLRVCGPLVVVFGVLYFFMEQSAPTWRRHTTSDGFASAEFPAAPKFEQQTDTIEGVSSQRTTLSCEVPSKDLTLLLSFSSTGSNDPNISEADRLRALKAFFEKQGSSIVRESPLRLGTLSGSALDLQRDGGKVRIWMRFVFVAGKVYRVVVSSGSSNHDDPIITHFLDSFRIERTGN